MKKTNRRTFLEKTSKAALGIAAASIGINVSEATEKPSTRNIRCSSNTKNLPNILHIVVHDLGKDLACLGHPDVKTPHLDQFASEGVLFTNHFCNSTPCSPARGCAMTGRYAHTNGLIALAHLGIHLPDSEQTIVDYLNDAGYETYNFGLQHERATNKNRYKHIDDVPRFVKPTANNAIEFLKNYKPSDGPFYANVGTHEPHKPWNRPDLLPYQAKYNADQIKMRPFLPDLKLYRQELKQYYGIITYMDEHIGRILDTLKQTGLDKDTLVIFTTDHGVPFPRAKGTLYDPGLTTTMIMRWPGRFKAGVKFTDQTQHVDLLPTILDLANLPIHPRIQGRSYAPFLLGKPYKPNDYFFSEMHFFGDWDPMRAVRTSRYKLIRNYAQRCRFRHPWEMKEGDNKNLIYLGPEERPYEELYDLKEDPNEFQNVAGKPEAAPILKDLRAQMDRWQDETADFMRGGYNFCSFPAADKRFIPFKKSEANPFKSGANSKSGADRDSE